MSDIECLTGGRRVMGEEIRRVKKTCVWDLVSFQVEEGMDDIICDKGHIYVNIQTLNRV